MLQCLLVFIFASSFGIILKHNLVGSSLLNIDNSDSQDGKIEKEECAVFISRIGLPLEVLCVICMWPISSHIALLLDRLLSVCQIVHIG